MTNETKHPIAVARHYSDDFATGGVVYVYARHEDDNAAIHDRNRVADVIRSRGNVPISQSGRFGFSVAATAWRNTESDVLAAFDVTFLN